MKKLKLNLQNIEGVEFLTRAQLKMVTGGDGGSGGSTCSATCKTGKPDQYTITIENCKECSAKDDVRVTCQDPKESKDC